MVLVTTVQQVGVEENSIARLHLDVHQFKASGEFLDALTIGAGLIPLVAPRWNQQMPHALAPLLESGILLTSISAVLLNLYFNGSKGDVGSTVAASKMAEAH